MKKYICTVCDYIYDRKWAILTVVLNQEQLLKTSRMIGYVLFAEWGKKTLKSIMNSDERVSD